ncbi:MAG: pitrilysin family protein [Candidatus Caenarcaniphilales bacterium]|nr:pitrilysin family protein [Candidatus Caenarcaniphilales bacterium]
MRFKNIKLFSIVNLLFLASYFYSNGPSQVIAKAAEAKLNKHQKSKINMGIDSTKEITLKNGLKVLIKEDHSAPIFSQAIFYRVGSRNDFANKSGMAHYLEHMQFNGTETRKKGSISKDIETRGGSFNAATSTDYTMYYMTLPSEEDNLDFSLELEADRMRNSIINETEAKREQQVVLSELLGGENNPMTLLSREVLKNLFPNHPYGIPIIGWQDEVSALDANDLKEFYDVFYQPNNAVLILVGDLDTEKTIEKIESYYGQIPSSSKELPPISQKTNITSPSEKEVQVKSPTETLILMMSWKVVDFGDKDYVPLSVLSAVLTNGSLSRLEKKLVDEGKASYVSSSVRQGIDPFTFSIIAATSQEGDLEEIQSIVSEEIERIKKEGVSSSELERVKAKSQTSFLFGIEEPKSLAAQLGFFELVSGDWKRTFVWPKEIDSVTEEQVKEVANKYLNFDNLVVGKLEDDPQDIPPASSFDGVLPTTANYKPEDKEDLQTIDKGIQPEFVELSNGIKVVLRKNPSLPILAISGTVDAGEVFEKDFGQDGTSAVTALMLDRGSENFTRDALDLELENIGADIEFSPERDYVGISAKSRAKDFDKLIGLVAEQIKNPKFPEDEFNKLRIQLLSEMNQSKDELKVLGKIAIYGTIYNKKHPYHELEIPEQIEAVKNITTDKLRRFHKKYYQPERLILSISGDFQKEKIISSIEKHFAGWENSGETEQYHVPSAGMKDPIAQTIEVPGKSQAVVLLGHSNEITRDHPDFYPLLVANDILGGGSTLTSRLGQTVREEAGLVYSIYSYVSMSRGAGPFIVQMGVPVEKIEKAVELTKKVINDFIEGDITDEELERAKNYRSGFFVSHNLTSNENIASSLNQYALWGMDLETINEYPEKIKSVTKEDVINVLRRYIHPDKLNLIILRPPTK